MYASDNYYYYCCYYSYYNCYYQYQVLVLIPLLDIVPILRLSTLLVLEKYMQIRVVYVCI